MNDITRVNYLVMESLALGTLRDSLRAAPLDTSTKLDIVTNITAAICSLHSSNPPFVHAAIRTKHVLLDDKLTAKVMNATTYSSRLLHRIIWCPFAFPDDEEFLIDGSPPT